MAEGEEESQFDRWKSELGSTAERGVPPESGYRNSRGPRLLRLIATVMRNDSETIADSWTGEIPKPAEIRERFDTMILKLEEAMEAVRLLQWTIFKIAFERHPVDAMLAIEAMLANIDVSNVEDVLYRALGEEERQFLQMLYPIINAECERLSSSSQKPEAKGLSHFQLKFAIPVLVRI